MLEELAVATLLGKAMGIAATVVIERFTEEQIDILKRTLLNGAETEDEITLPQHYNAYVVGKFCEKEKSSLVSKEALSQESVYIDAYVKHGENEPEEKILDTIEEWSEEESSGVMLIHGEPGHGKTTLCRKAVYEHYLERFCKDKTNVFWFRLNPAYSDIIDKNGDLVLENAFCWGNIKTQRKMIYLDENEDAYRGSIIFLDGYDELKVQAKSRLHDFIDKVKDYAEDYQIHFVITARTRSVGDELYGLGIPTLQFAPMTEKQQIDWIHKRKELHEYEEKFVKLRKSSEEMGEMLGIPILFRMVVREKLESTTAQNVVGLYDTLFEATMKRRKMESGSREDWHKKYEQLAYEIYCNDDNFADMRKMDMPEEFLYMFHLKGEGKQHVEFLHRSFYQYFLAHFLYRKMSEIKDEASAEAFLCCLAERRIDDDVLNYIQQIQEKKPDVTWDKCEQIINKLEQTGTIIVQALDAPNKSGDAEKYPLLRCENVLINALRICCIVAATEESEFITSLYEKENIHTAMRRYNCCGIMLKNVNLNGADLSKAKLNGAELNGAELNGANLIGADLREVDLGGANLSEADLSGANLNRTDLSRTNLSRARLRRASLIGADLSKADLSRANLSKARLSRASLIGADLSKVDLREVDLSRADLREVDLGGANLSRADLSGANLSGINLSRADLSRTNLNRANLTGANLTEVDLTEASLSGTDLSGADLTGANLNDLNLRWTKNLDKCNCAQVAAWTGCEISLRDRDNLGLDDPDAYGIIWCDNYGIPIKS